jgi:hypothetical protein
MKKQQEKGLSELLEVSGTLATATTYEGFLTDDKNIPNHKLLVESQNSFYSFNETDIIRIEEFGDNKVKIWVRNGAKAFRSSLFTTGISNLTEIPFLVGMEDIKPPVPIFDPNAPLLSTEADIELFISKSDMSIMNLNSAYSLYNGRCVRGDSYPNNCAHFLSDAFLRAGYNELLPNNPHINARCPSQRPIRARDMWSWFRAKARRTSNTPTRNTGTWAVFQLNESEYWGGHVCILDSNAWKYNGTGWFPNWNQYLYQW